MNQPLQDKPNLALRLSGYAASAGALIAIGSTANGQALYSGLQNLEVNMPFEYLEIDMNGDLINDFGFYMYGSSYFYSDTYIYYNYKFGYGVIINPKTDSYDNSWIIKTTVVSAHYETASVPMVNGLDIEADINNSQSMWSDISYPYWAGAMGVGSMLTYYSPYYSIQRSWEAGDFIGEEKYIGVRFYIGTEQHYGWIRASMGDELEPMTIIDWAYVLTPGVGITTGLPVIGFSGVDEATTNAIQTLSITFSEEVTGFEIGDIVVTNGTPANLIEVTAGLEYSVEITADTEGEVGVEINADAVSDLDANGNLAAEISWMYDLTSPSITIDPGVSGTINDQTVMVTVQFNEEIEEFGLGDLTVTNGTAANLEEVVPGMEFTVEITAGADGEVVVEIDANTVSDLAGNENDVAASASWIYDGTSPTVTFNSVPTVTNSQTVTISVDFSEEISGLEIGDFIVSNGTVSNLTEVTTGTEFTIDITADIEGEVIVVLPQGAVADIAGNENDYVSSTFIYDDSVGNSVGNLSEGSINIYPNPADDMLHIELENESAVSIINLNGSVLYQNTRLLNETISLSSFLPGIYIVQVKNGEKITQHRLVIE